MFINIGHHKKKEIFILFLQTASSDIQFPTSNLHPNIWHINFLWMIHGNTHHRDLRTLTFWSTCHSYTLQLTHSFPTSTPSIIHNIFLHTLRGRNVSFLTILLSNQLFINYSIECTNFWHQATNFLLLFFLNRVYQQKYFWATQDFSPIHCSVNTEDDESYYPSWHTTFCTIRPRPFSFMQFLNGQINVQWNISLWCTSC